LCTTCVLYLRVYECVLWGHRACSNNSSLRLRYFRRFGALRAQRSRRSWCDSGVAFRILCWVFGRGYTSSAVRDGSTTRFSPTTGHEHHKSALEKTYTVASATTKRLPSITSSAAVPPGVPSARPRHDNRGQCLVHKIDFTEFVVTALLPSGSKIVTYEMITHILQCSLY